MPCVPGPQSKIVNLNPCHTTSGQIAGASSQRAENGIHSYEDLRSRDDRSLSGVYCASGLGDEGGHKVGACAAPRLGRTDVLVEVRSRASLPLRTLRLAAAAVDAAYLSTTQPTRSTCLETSSTSRGSRGPFTSHGRPFIACTRPLRRYTRTRPLLKEHARCPWRRGTLRRRRRQPSPPRRQHPA